MDSVKSKHAYRGKQRLAYVVPDVARPLVDNLPDLNRDSSSLDEALSSCRQLAAVRMAGLPLGVFVLYSFSQVYNRLIPGVCFPGSSEAQTFPMRNQSDTPANRASDRFTPFEGGTVGGEDSGFAIDLGGLLRLHDRFRARDQVGSKVNDRGIISPQHLYHLVSKHVA